MVETDRRRSRGRRGGRKLDLRPVAQLRMLHNLAAQLNRLNDRREIGDAIASELQTLIDYHSCRIYLLQPDGVTLAPIVFHGELLEYQGETYDALVTQMGEGMTGRTAETGESFITPNANDVPWAVQIPGTPEVDESVMCVPLKYGDVVIGVITLSKLGVDQFDEDDLRLLEVLASHAAVAFENARLFQLEREAGETASALLGLSQTLTGVHDVAAVLQRIVGAASSIIGCSAAAAYVRDPDVGASRLIHATGSSPERFDRLRELDVPDEIVRPFTLSTTEPFVLPPEMVERFPEQYRLVPEPRENLIAQIRWEPDGFGILAIVAPDTSSSFGEREVTLARGIADIASLALGSARRFHELERFQELVESLEAIFWEADADDLGFRFLSRRASVLLGRPEDSGETPAVWGEHIVPEDRPAAEAAIRREVADGGSRSLEYRAIGRGGDPIWLRDVVHVVRDARGAKMLRGLILDITERKRAEQQLRKSEQQYSEAFRREREATQRLRALDEMKNTFLEAVSHDLRTPLTSILGSALTLEQSGLDMPRDDALDLLRRIASNARKLERLLSDLLDLDRLQRGIVSPQRRPTELDELVRRVIDDTDVPEGRVVEVDASPLTLSIDAAKVERIVENLLSNAIRHTPPDGKIWVRVAPQDGGALISVEDEGAGVPAELLQAIFEPFRQVPGIADHSPGVGIGLSLVARFAELHGGRAWAEERPGGGSSFRVLLPAR
jgi:PAS domain S-box-containing protein